MKKTVLVFAAALFAFASPACIDTTQNGAVDAGTWELGIGTEQKQGQNAFPLCLRYGVTDHFFLTPIGGGYWLDLSDQARLTFGGEIFGFGASSGDGKNQSYYDYDTYLYASHRQNDALEWAFLIRHEGRNSDYEAYYRKQEIRVEPIVSLSAVSRAGLALKHEWGEGRFQDEDDNALYVLEKIANSSLTISYYRQSSQRRFLRFYGGYTHFHRDSPYLGTESDDDKIHSSFGAAILWRL